MKILSIIVLTLFFTFSISAQENADWFIKLKSIVEQKEPSWKISQEKQERGKSCFVYNLILKSGKQYSAVRVAKYDDTAIAKEIFAGLINITRKIIDNQATEVKLDKLGDEGYLWKIKGDTNWTRIMFREQMFFVTVTAPSDILARKLAGYVTEQIPNNHLINPIRKVKILRNSSTNPPGFRRFPRSLFPILFAENRPIKRRWF